MDKATNKDTKQCKYCGMEIPKNAKVCPHCRKKQGGNLKKIIGIIVIILILVVIFGGGSEDSSSKDTAKTNSSDTAESSSVEQTDTAETEETTDEEDESDSDSVITVGGTIEKTGLKITVDDVSADFTDYDNSYGFNTSAEGMKYVMASFTFENTGSSDKYVSIYDFDCYADNASCEQVYTLGDSSFINENLSSGRTVSFQTYYEVPIDAQSIELEYEINAWTSEKAIIKIQ